MKPRAPWLPRPAVGGGATASRQIRFMNTPAPAMRSERVTRTSRACKEFAIMSPTGVARCQRLRKSLNNTAGVVDSRSLLQRHGGIGGEARPPVQRQEQRLGWGWVLGEGNEGQEGAGTKSKVSPELTGPSTTSHIVVFYCDCCLSFSRPALLYRTGTSPSFQGSRFETLPIFC